MKKSGRSLKLLVGNPEETVPLGYKDIDGRIILKYNLEEIACEDVDWAGVA